MMCLGKQDDWNILRINDNPKAPGLDCTLKYPPGWSVSKGERPHVLHLIKKENKYVIFMVNMLPMEVSAEDVDDMFTEEDIKTMIPKNSHFIKCSKTKLEGQPAWIIMYSQTAERLGKRVTDSVLVCLLVYKKFMIQMQSHYVLTPEDIANAPNNPTITAEYKAAIKEGLEIFNTLVINNIYK